LRGWILRTSPPAV